jgi:hypothetical protein
VFDVFVFVMFVQRLSGEDFKLYVDVKRMQRSRLKRVVSRELPGAAVVASYKVRDRSPGLKK